MFTRPGSMIVQSVAWMDECMGLRLVSIAINLGMVNPLLIIIKYLELVLNEDISRFKLLLLALILLKNSLNEEKKTIKL